MTESVIHALISAAGVIPAHSSPKPSSYMANQLCVLAGATCTCSNNEAAAAAAAAAATNAAWRHVH